MGHRRPGRMSLDSGGGWIARISSSTRSSVAASSWCTDCGIVTGNEIRRSQPWPAEQLGELLAADTSEHRGVGDLVAVQVQDRQTAPSPTGSRNLFECHAAASGPVSASPSPITQARPRVGIVERGAEGVAQRIAELPAFVDRSRRLGRNVTRYAARKGELPEKAPHAVAVQEIAGYSSE